MEWKELLLRAASTLGAVTGEEPIGYRVAGSGCCVASLLHALRAERRFRRCLRLETSAQRCHILIVAGRIAVKAAPGILAAYRDIEEPRCVVAIGTCASSGALFDTYGAIAGASELFPVDLFIPGCPPSPEAIRSGLREAAEQVRLFRSSSRVAKVARVRIGGLPSGLGGKFGRESR